MKTKQGFTWVLVLGIITAFSTILAPIHEVFHWLAAILTGVDAEMELTQTIIYGDVSLLIGFAGMFGELTVFLVLFLLFIKYDEWFMATFVYGYIIAIGLAITWILSCHIPIADLEAMYKTNSTLIVNIIFSGWLLFYILVMIFTTFGIYYFRDKFYGGESMMVKGARSILAKARADADAFDKQHNPPELKILQFSDYDADVF